MDGSRELRARGAPLRQSVGLFGVLTACMFVAACNGSAAAPQPRLALAQGLDAGRAYRLVDLSRTKGALSMILSVSGADAYRVTFERSGTVTFQQGLVGGYWLNRERVPSLYPYGGWPREPDAWQPSSHDAWTSDVGAAAERTLFEEQAAWVARGIGEVPCGERPTHYVATNQVTRTKPIAILLRSKDPPIRLDCDGRADELIRQATSLLEPLTAKVNRASPPG